MDMLFLVFYIALSAMSDLEIHASNQPKKTITLGYLTGSRRSPDDYFYRIPGRTISGAISLAVRDVNNDPRTLPDHVLEFAVAETHGKELESVRQTVNLIQQNVSVIIGPQETCSYEARIAAAFNLPMISYFCPDPRLSDKAIYPTFARTKPHDSQICSAVVSVFRRYGWTSAVIVYSESQADLESTLHGTLEDHNVTVADSRSFSDHFLQGLTSFTSHGNIIRDTLNKANVYILVADLYDGFRSFLFELKSQGHRTHTVLGVDTKHYDSNDPQKYIEGYFIHDNIPENTKAAFRDFLLLAPSAPVDPGYQNFSRLVNHYLEAPPFNFYNPFASRGILKTIRSEASYLYDAVWLYAKAAHSALQQGHDVSDGRVIIDLIKGMSYKSAMGFHVQIDDNGDTQGNYTLLSSRDSRQGYGMFPVAYLAEDGNSGMMQYLALRDIQRDGDRA